MSEPAPPPLPAPDTAPEPSPIPQPAESPAREPEPRRTPRAATRVAQATGKVRIQAIPSATVKQGSRVLGVTPVTLELPAGEHKLILENTQLNVRRPLVVNIVAGKETAVLEQMAQAQADDDWVPAPH